MGDIRPQANVLVNTAHGPMIVNRNDYKMVDDNTGYGVGFQLFNTGEYDAQEISLAKYILHRRLRDYPGNVVAVDGGANIGVHTIEWAKMLGQSGQVLAIEAQESIFYMLAGNVALNNCFNVKLLNAAIGEEDGELEVPAPNYFAPGTFGSLEMRQHDGSEDIGQAMRATKMVAMIALDTLNMDRLDFLKLDVEGMEMEALQGAWKTINKCKPVMLIECIKVAQEKLRDELQSIGYDVYRFGGNFLAVHESDKMAGDVSVEDDNLRIG